jgi:filamentous hemagglutinin family protein
MILFTKQGFTQISTLVAMALILSNCPVQALPTGYEVVAGDVQFASPDASTLNITSQSNQAIINYQGFNILQGEAVNFLMPNSSASILNNVIGGAASQILGTLNSNGNVILVNPTGINFGPTARIDAGSILASTLRLSNQDFLNDNYMFTQDLDSAPGAIVNQGKIAVQQGGHVVFAGGAIKNTGTITAPLGQIHLAVGDQITVAIGNGVFIDTVVDQTLQNRVEAYNTAIVNSGTLQADGGIIRAQALLKQNLYSQAVNTSGIIRVQSVEMKNGQITLLSGPTSDAIVENTGTLDVRGTETAPNGGNILLTGVTVNQSGMVLLDGHTSEAVTTDLGIVVTPAIQGLDGTMEIVSLSLSDSASGPTPGIDTTTEVQTGDTTSTIDTTVSPDSAEADAALDSSDTSTTVDTDITVDQPEDTSATTDVDISQGTSDTSVNADTDINLDGSGTSLNTETGVTLDPSNVSASIETDINLDPPDTSSGNDTNITLDPSDTSVSVDTEANVNLDPADPSVDADVSFDGSDTEINTGIDMTIDPSGETTTVDTDTSLGTTDATVNADADVTIDPSEPIDISADVDLEQPDGTQSGIDTSVSTGQPDDTLVGADTDITIDETAPLVDTDANVDSPAVSVDVDTNIELDSNDTSMDTDADANTDQPDIGTEITLELPEPSSDVNPDSLNTDDADSTVDTFGNDQTSSSPVVDQNSHSTIGSIFRQLHRLNKKGCWNEASMTGTCSPPEHNTENKGDDNETQDGLFPLNLVDLHNHFLRMVLGQSPKRTITTLDIFQKIEPEMPQAIKIPTTLKEEQSSQCAI